MTDIIGYFVFWSARHVRITRDKFNALLRDEGITIDIKKAKPTTAFCNATSEIRKKTIGRNWHIQKIKEENFRRWYGIYDAKRTELWDDLELKQAATMEFDARTGELTCDWPHKTFIFFRDMYTWYMEGVCYEDIHNWFQRILSSRAGIPMRDGGIVYFFPRDDEKITISLQRIFAATSKTCWLAAIPQIKTPPLCKLINRFVFHTAQKEAEKYKTWIYPKIRTIDITDVDLRLTILYIFKRKVEMYMELTDFKGEPYLALAKEAIKGFKEKREQIFKESPTQLQKMKYFYNKRSYPIE
jgi:hypothetical protein